MLKYIFKTIIPFFIVSFRHLFLQAYTNNSFYNTPTNSNFMFVLILNMKYDLEVTCCQRRNALNLISNIKFCFSVNYTLPIFCLRPVYNSCSIYLLQNILCIIIQYSSVSTILVCLVCWGNVQYNLKTSVSNTNHVRCVMLWWYLDIMISCVI